MYEPHWPELTRKRPREDEGGDGFYSEAKDGTLSFTEHRSKRLQYLPLRTSPTQKPWSGPLAFPTTTSTVTPPTTITPTDSDSEDVQFRQQSNLPMDMDRDTDMMVDYSSEHIQPGHLQPNPIDPSIAGRMPTPIHCTFAAQVRGNNWGSMNVSAHAADGSAGAAISISDDGTSFAQPSPFPSRHDTSSVPRSLGGAAEWSIVQNRRLPSPISESGGEDTPTSPGMLLDSHLPSASHLQRPYLPHMPHSTNPHAMAIHPNILAIPPIPDGDVGMMDTDGASSPLSAPATPSPRGKFGHSRSKHTLNSWTLQPGMKKSFSIGYRADCEKCRLKIPGHFNHIVIS